MFRLQTAGTGFRTIMGSLLAVFAAGVAAARTEPPTYYRDVAPLLQKHCQDCHRPGGANLGGMVAPMALTTYEETRPWARSISRLAAARMMPPWHASEAQHGVFENERPEYDFNWQTTYIYGERKKIPQGTKVVLTTTYDNSAGNIHNPDPDATVRWGEETTYEMSYGFVAYINESNQGPAGITTARQGGMTAVVAYSDALSEHRDGKMQLEELKRASKTSPSIGSASRVGAAPPELLERFFERLDANDDGAVDMDEARAAAGLLRAFASQAGDAGERRPRLP